MQDLLISVTNFFRDPETFQALEAHVPALFASKGPGDQVRVWVAACATGEEAYSIAMLLLEYAATLDMTTTIQIFATDIDEIAIAAAHDAVYPDTIAADVSEARLALRPEGRLCLSSAESADEACTLFSSLDKKHRIYARRAGQRPTLPVPIGSSTLGNALEHTRQISAAATATAVQASESHKLSSATVPFSEAFGKSWSDVHFKLIERLGTPSLLVNSEYEILHLSENVSRFLRIAGEPTMNLLRVVHPMLRVEVSAALFQARQTGAPVDVRGVLVDFDGARRAVDVGVRPAPDLVPGCLLVVFREREESDTGEALAVPGWESILHQIEAELEHTKLQLRENLEQSEEMKAATRNCRP